MDGFLGAGVQLSTAGLSVGEHTITLEMLDEQDSDEHSDDPKIFSSGSDPALNFLDPDPLLLQSLTVNRSEKILFRD